MSHTADIRYAVRSLVASNLGWFKRTRETLGEAAGRERAININRDVLAEWYEVIDGLHELPVITRYAPGDTPVQVGYQLFVEDERTIRLQGGGKNWRLAGDAIEGDHYDARIGDLMLMAFDRSTHTLSFMLIRQADTSRGISDAEARAHEFTLKLLGPDRGSMWRPSIQVMAQVVDEVRNAYPYVDLLLGIPRPRVWVEQAHPARRTDAASKFGAVLFSPQVNRAGARIYEEMRQVRIGDIVVHLDIDKKAILGVARVAGPLIELAAGDQSVTTASYQVPLEEYASLGKLLPTRLFLGDQFAETLSEIDATASDAYAKTGTKQLFYESTADSSRGRRYKRTGYLTEAPAPLVALMASAYRQISGESLPHGLGIVAEVEILDQNEELESELLSLFDPADLMSRIEAGSAGKKKAKRATRITESNVRDPLVSAFAKACAAGICDRCGDEAPFVTKRGHPYLETHHVLWLAVGGLDTPDNVVALCPNCHRLMHGLNPSHDRDHLGMLARERAAKYDSSSATVESYMEVAGVVDSLDALSDDWAFAPPTTAR